MEIERDFGIQPLDALMTQNNLSNHDLVAASSEQLTHKMVAKARKGRRLTRHVQMKIVRALNAATGKLFTLRDLFNY